MGQDVYHFSLSGLYYPVLILIRVVDDQGLKIDGFSFFFRTSEFEKLLADSFQGKGEESRCF